MKPTVYCAATIAGAALLAVSLIAPLPAASAQTKGASATASAAAPVDNTPTGNLPVKAVTLFSSGVSFTLREGEVSGKATVPLLFRTAQINDILKSLVLLDENGTVQPAILQSKDPIGRTLSGFAVDVSRPPSLADLLNQLRGARVVVEAGGDVIAANTQTPKRTLEGQIVGVEGTERGGIGGFGGGATAYLSVLGDAGLQTVRLAEVKSVRLLDERLNQEFKDALSLLAAGSDDKRRTVTLQFDGKGTRRVRVGYVGEAPLWKISYRLLLGGGGISGVAAPKTNGENKTPPYLQGWAMVENTTDEDWQNVRLSLVSGRPVSFIQDLYQPLYVPRPVVPPDVVASPFPQLAEGAIESDDAKKADIGGIANGSVGGRGGGFGGGAMPAPAMTAAPAAKNRAFRSAPGSPAAETLADESVASNFAAIRGSVVAQASGESAGELFRYNINTPVTLPRQQAALIPVIAQDIKGEKVSVYNADADARFPLNAVRLINNTTLNLKGGPVTIFDDGVYAGDARMENIGPGDNRLLTYAVDLGVEGERKYGNGTQTETSISIRRGVLITTRRERQETNYSFKNKTDRTRTVLVEHPYASEYKLIAPVKADERTANLYRFPVTVAPGKTEKLQVILERPLYESVELVNQDIDGLLVYVQRKDISPKLKAALEEVVSRRRKINDLRSRAAGMDAEIASIDKDQERIRKNMAALDKASALYKRYVTQLDSQESRIQKLRDESARLKNEAGEAERNLRAYLDGLDVAA